METRRSSRLESSSSNSTINGRTVLPSSFSSHVLCYWVGTATEDTSFCTVHGRAAIYLGDHQFLYGWTCMQQAPTSPLSPTWQMGIDQPPDMPAPVRPFQMLPCMLAPGSHFARLFAGVPIKEKLRPTEYALCRSHSSSRHGENLWLNFFFSLAEISLVSC